MLQAIPEETELQLEQTTGTPIEIEIDENSSSNSMFDFAPLKPSELNVSVAGGCLCTNSTSLSVAEKGKVSVIFL